MSIRMVRKIIILTAFFVLLGWRYQAEALPWSMQFLDNDADRVYYYRDVSPDELKFTVSGLPVNMSLIARFGYLEDEVFVPTNALINSNFTSYTIRNADQYTFNVFVQQAAGDNQCRPLAFEIGYIDGGYQLLGSMQLSDGISSAYTNIKPPPPFLEEGSQTTDFTADPLNIKEINGLIFDRPGKSRITFDGTVNILADIEKIGSLEDYADMGVTGVVGFDTGQFQSLAGRSAVVNMYELTFAEAPVIFVYDSDHNLIDGAGIVSNENYNPDTGELSFSVSHLSSFEAAGLELIQLTPDAAGIRVGDTVELNATEIYSNGEMLTLDNAAWSSSDTTIAAVDDTGLVTGLTPGVCVISATKSDVTGEANINVTAAELEQITVSPTEAVVTAGRTYQFSAAGRFSNGETLALDNAAWSSSDPAVAAVDDTGLVTGLTPGVCVISANRSDVTGEANITVTAAELEQITVSPTEAVVKAGRTYQFTAAGRFSNGETLPLYDAAWDSSNPAVALVGNTGQVLGLSAGSCKITAGLDGINGEASLIVRKRSSGTSTGSSSEGSAIPQPEVIVESKGKLAFCQFISWPGLNLTMVIFDIIDGIIMDEV